MILAHKIALDPNKAQSEYFARAAGTARFAWNWALARWKQEYALWREYRCGPKPSDGALQRELNALKGDAFPWMAEVTKTAPQHAIMNLGAAFKNFFEGRARYPQFKIARIVARAAQQAGIEFHVHPHALRHSAGHMLANEGTDTRLIQDFLGHRDVRYAALSPARLASVRVR